MHEIAKLVSALDIEFDREVDGRWIADIPELPGVMTYGLTKQDAQRRVIAMAECVLADLADPEGQSECQCHLLDYGVARR